MDEFAAALGRAWTDDEPARFLAELTGLPDRMGGSPGEREAAGIVADAFRDAGLADVETRGFDAAAWERGETTLAIEGTGRSPPAIALPYSPAGTVTAPVVDVGYGTPDEIAAADVDGAVVVASTTTPAGSRFLHRMEKYGTAVEAGAAGFLFANHVRGQLPPTGSLRFGEEASVPAAGVSYETGERLRALADPERSVSSEDERPHVGHRGGAAARDGTEAGTGTDRAGSDGDGAPTRVTLDVDATTTPGESQNVLGRLGPESDRAVLAVAHYDAHDVAEGALDNGCGIATLVTAARVLASADTELDREVRFAAVGCEEVGLLGAEALADRLDLDGVAGVCNVDGAGRFRNLVAMTHTSEATADVAREVTATTGHPVDVVPEPHPFSDQWPFVRRGVPALQLHSRADDPAAATGEGADGGVGGGRGWGHTEADTLDKVDTRNVREHGMLAAVAIRELAAAGRSFPRLETEALRAAFVDGDYEPGMRAAGMWPEAWDTTDEE